MVGLVAFAFVLESGRGLVQRPHGVTVGWRRRDHARSRAAFSRSATQVNTERRPSDESQGAVNHGGERNAVQNRRSDVDLTASQRLP
jgi:hypothetical protein